MARSGARVNPPRPPNSWILYRSYMLRKLQAKMPTKSLSQGCMSRVISGLWRAATPAAKRPFEQLAERMKQRHYAKYPDYKYRPRKKEEKERDKALQLKQRQERLAQKRDMRSKRGVSKTTPPSRSPPMQTPYCTPFMMGVINTLSPPLSAASSPITPPAVAFQPVLSPIEPMLPAHLQFTLEPPSQVMGTNFQPSVAPNPYDYLATPICLPPSNACVDTVWPSSFLHFSRDGLRPGHQFQLPLNNPLQSSFLETSGAGHFEVRPSEQDTKPSSMIGVANVVTNLEVGKFIKVAYEQSIATAAASASTESLPTDVNHTDQQFDFHFDWPAVDPLLNGLELFDLPYSMPTQSDLYFNEYSPTEFSTPDLFSDFALIESTFPSPEPRCDVAPAPAPYVPPSGAMLSSTRRVAGRWTLPKSQG